MGGGPAVIGHYLVNKPFHLPGHTSHEHTSTHTLNHTVACKASAQNELQNQKLKVRTVHHVIAYCCILTLAV